MVQLVLFLILPEVLFILFFLQAVNPLNTLLNDPNRNSILGRVVRVTDQVIHYRQWIREHFAVPPALVNGVPHPLDTTRPRDRSLHPLDCSLRITPSGLSSLRITSRKGPKTDSKRESADAAIVTSTLEEDCRTDAKHANDSSIENCKNDTKNDDVKRTDKSDIILENNSSSTSPRLKMGQFPSNRSVSSVHFKFRRV